MRESYSGPGTLFVGDKEFPCTYSLSIYPSGTMRTGNGTIEADYMALWASFEADRSRIRMENGRSFPIIIRSLGGGQGRAPFDLAGAISDVGE